MTGRTAGAGFEPWFRLVRAPAALTVPGDVIAGAAAVGGHRLSAATGAAMGASVCLYWSGMALNDYADREQDAKERPERPIPSGQVKPGAALAAASGLTAAGLALAAVAGRRTLAVAIPLTAAVWAYDLALKDTRFGCATMAAARGLDVLMGGACAGRISAALPPAAMMSAHTYAVTELSRGEVGGAQRAVPAVTLAASGAIAVAAVVQGRIRPSGVSTQTRLDRAAGTLLSGVYLACFGRPQAAAVADPSAMTVRRAVGAGIHAMLPLQAALTAARGGRISPLPLVAALPLARRLSRKVSPT